MLFNSHFFIFVFLPLTLLGYFLIGARGQRPAAVWLSLCSLFFYGWWNPKYLILILTSIVFNYFTGVWINRAVETNASGCAKRFLALGVTVNLGALGYFKYADFFIANTNALFGAKIAALHLVLPLAISFFTFTQIAYLVDAFHGRTRAYDFLYYFLFVSFFPHLIAGPIVLYKSLMPQFAERETYRWNTENFASGATMFVLGLCKKVVIADTLSPLANAVFGSTAGGVPPGLTAAWIGALAYTFQLYFDFSGYSDMAIGIARMFNTRFPLNFDSPYRAQDIIDFWRRWHITLSTFLRDHLYIPFGGNRKGPIRRYLNLFLTMLLGGLWHGAGWTFVMWGALHGFYLMVNHGWGQFCANRPWSNGPVPRFAGRILTILAVIVGWVFFRSANFTSATQMLAGMIGLHGIGTAPKIGGLTLLMLVGAAGLAFFAPNTNELLRLAISNKTTGQIDPPRWALSRITALATGTLFVLAILHLSRISEFLYFQF